MLLRVVIAVADDTLRKRLRLLLRTIPDVVMDVAKGKEELWERALAKEGDILVVDEAVACSIAGKPAATNPDSPQQPAVVAMTNSISPAEHTKLIEAGCDWVLYNELEDERLVGAFRTILAKQMDLMRAALTRKPLATPSLGDFVSESPTMREFMEVVRRVVHSDASLLILGETGVGKERLARAIHAEGPRAAGPFVAVNCGALPEALLESELFGHEEGAFTGATRGRRGAFELAHGGTIFLDEVGDMPIHLQVKLLRVLQDHEVQRIGAEAGFRVDVRVMAASNRDLAAEVEAKRFRQDLFYRLSVVTLTVPALRDRREDIPALARSYVGFHRPRIGREVYGISPQAVEALCRYPWPGNVRELINVIERAMLLCKDREISLGELPTGIRTYGKAAGQPAFPQRAEDIPEAWLTRPLKDLRDEVVAGLEKAYLTAVLKTTGGRIGQAADRSGLQPRSLYEKMREYGLAKEDFKGGRNGKSESGGGGAAGATAASPAHAAEMEPLTDEAAEKGPG